MDEHSACRVSRFVSRLLPNDYGVLFSWVKYILAYYSNPVVTVYATLGKDALAYALDQAAVSTLFVDQTLLKNVVEIMNGKTIESSEGEVVVNLAHLKRIVLISDYPSNTKESQDVSSYA